MFFPLEPLHIVLFELLECPIELIFCLLSSRMKN